MCKLLASAIDYAGSPQNLNASVHLAITAGRNAAERIAEEQSPRCEARQILARIPQRILAAKTQKKSEATVMFVNVTSDIQWPSTPHTRTQCSGAWLTGAAWIVWNICTQAGLSPELRYWSDCGEERFDLVIPL